MRCNVLILLLSTVYLIATACSGGSTSSVPAGMNSTLAIDAFPQDQTEIEGQTATFRVSASSAAPLSYQWLRDGNVITGATGTTFETGPLSMADDGAQFAVRISTEGTSAVSDVATVHVYSDLNIPAPAEYIINPAETDPAVDASFGDHYAYINTAVSLKNKLFLFFPGTDARPQAYKLIIRWAANNGFHAVGLAYPNSVTVASYCGGTDSQCPGSLHEEVLTGQDVSPQIDINPADSIEHRLTKLLQYLDEHHPADGWGRFLDGNGAAIWSAVRTAGHSQGGATAGFIGTQYVVDRAIFFSSPHDELDNEVAAWMSTPGATDAADYFGFAHQQDGIIPWRVIQQNWTVLHMNDFGSYLDVDNSLPPYDNSHMLYSDMQAPAGSVLLPYHNITVLDISTPTDASGLPTYLPVWQYLCFL